MGAYERDDPSIGSGRSEAERRRAVRCEICGVPWEDHTEDHCRYGHARRPQWVQDAEAVRYRTFWEVLTGAYANGNGGNGAHA